MAASIARRAAHVGLALVVAAAIASCFSLSFDNGTLQCSDDPRRLCPSGYVCITRHCWSIPQLDLGYGIDGGLILTPFDAATD